MHGTHAISLVGWLKHVKVFLLVALCTCKLCTLLTLFCSKCSSWPDDCCITAQEDMQWYVMHKSCGVSHSSMNMCLESEPFIHLLQTHAKQTQKAQLYRGNQLSPNSLHSLWTRPLLQQLPNCLQCAAPTVPCWYISCSTFPGLIVICCTRLLMAVHFGKGKTQLFTHCIIAFKRVAEILSRLCRSTAIIIV